MIFSDKKIEKQNFKLYCYKLLEIIYKPAQTAPFYLYSFRNDNNSKRTCQWPKMIKMTPSLKFTIFADQVSSVEDQVTLVVAQAPHKVA